MKQPNQSLLRKSLLPVAAVAVGVGALIGLPGMKALAQELKIAPRALQPIARLNIIQPKFVNANAAPLVAIADEALSNPALAERIFSEPDAVAAQYGLTDSQRLVLRKMTREQFATAQGDAERLTGARMAQAGADALPAGATDTRLIAERMIVGRAILDAVGRSYLEAADAHACCPWSKAIELGVNAKRVLYNQAFQGPASTIRQPAIQVIQSNERG